MNSEMARATFASICGRRSIRKYHPDPVPEDLLALVLESGRQAPSGENAQPWRFLIVKGEAIKETLGEIAGRGSGRRFTAEFVIKRMHQRFETLEDEQKKQAAFEKLTSGDVSSFLGKCPVVIVVVGRKDVWDLPFDTSAAIENMLLMAHALGLGACWVIAPCIDARDEKKMQALLGIPPGFKVISAISLGYSPYAPKARPRLPLKEIVFTETFGSPYYGDEPALRFGEGECS